MNEFRRYNHLVRDGHRAVSDLCLGNVYIFPKLDGTNASIWMDADGTLQTGSRNRIVTAEDDNAGFAAWFDEVGQVMFEDVLKDHPSWTIYGEWLVPHSLKTYREDAWRKFYVFDVYDRDTERFIPYDKYMPEMMIPYTWDKTGLNMVFIDIVPPQAMITDPTPEQIQAEAEKNTYLIKNGEGVGEGVVAKNYSWSAEGSQTWMKFVRNEFKELNQKAFGVPNKKGAQLVERDIVEEFLTETLVRKTLAKVVLDVANTTGEGGHAFVEQFVIANNRGKIIPQLLGRVFNDLIEEESWSFLKKFKNPTIDFRLLCKLAQQRTKKLLPEIF